MRHKKNEPGLSGKERCWDRAGPTPTHDYTLRPLSVFGKCKSGQRETQAPVCHKDKGRDSGVNISMLETRIANVNPTGVSFSETTAMNLFAVHNPYPPQRGERRQPGAREERPQPRDPAYPASIGPEGAGGTPRPPCAPSGSGNVADTNPRALPWAIAFCPFGAQEGGLRYGG
jgi:hypothetical protein